MYRNPKLLALVRKLPCSICGAGAPSQAAHSNLSEHGKGMAIKASDAAIFSACQKCHTEIDNGSIMSREELEIAQFQAISNTYIMLMEAGRISV